MSITPIVLDVVDDHWLGDIIGLALGLGFFGELGLALLGPPEGPVVAVATVVVGTTRVVVPLIRSCSASTPFEESSGRQLA